MIAGITAGGDGTFHLAGPAGFRAARSLLAEGARAFRATAAVTVDLGGITDMDSATLALLLEWRRDALKNGQTVRYTGVPPRLAALARLSGVAALLGLQGEAGSSAGPATGVSPAG